MAETTELRWFEEFPKCHCGQKSQGILRGSRNESYGHHCKRCAERRLKVSERERKLALKLTGQPLGRPGT